MSRVGYGWFAVALVAAIAAAAIVWNLRESKRANPGGVDNPTYENPLDVASEPTGPEGVELQNPSVVEYDREGRTLWSADSDGTFKVDDTTGTVTGTDVDWQLVRGAQSISVSAGRMEYDRAGRGHVSFAGGVTISAPGERRFSTDEARYDAEAEEVICGPGVEWTWREHSGSSGTLVLQLNTDKVICEGGVEWKWQGYSGSSDRLVLDPKNGKIRGRNGRLAVR